MILTATPAREPFLKAEWVQPGTHISCVGADMPGKQEVDSALFAAAKVFGDDTAQCLSVGECEVPYKAGVFSGELCEIGSVISGAELLYLVRQIIPARLPVRPVRRARRICGGSRCESRRT